MVVRFSMLDQTVQRWRALIYARLSEVVMSRDQFRDKIMVRKAD